MKVAFISAIMIFLIGMNVDIAWAESEGELAKKVQNPVAALISVPIKYTEDRNIGVNDASVSAFTVQPVIPVSLSDDWLVISRTVFPVYIDAESPVVGGKDVSGNGDITQTFFFTPKEKTSGGWIWGAGPIFNLPIASDAKLGSEKYSIGPAAVVLKQNNGWTVGGMVNHLSSVAGKENREEVSTSLLQPFAAYTTKTYTTFGVNTESTYDWKTNQWTVPINYSLGQILKLGGRPYSMGLTYTDYVEKNRNGPEWGFSLKITLLFPDK